MKIVYSSLRGIMKSVYFPLLVLILAASIPGIFLSGDYGLSWDEYVHVEYAQQVSEIFKGIRSPEDTITDLGFYGPLFSFSAEILTRLISGVPRNWSVHDTRHFVYYLSFLLGVAALYDLCLRFMQKKAAIISALLFYSQPVLFGHAFMNPKDIPFMSFFIVAVVAGFRVVDRVSVLFSETQEEVSPHGVKIKSKRRTSLSGFDWKRHRLLRILPAALLILLSLDFFLFNSLETLASRMLQQVYAGQGSRLLTSVFEVVASDAFKTPVDAYLQKIAIAFTLARRFLILSWFVAAAVFSCKLICRPGRGKGFDFVIPLSGFLLGMVVSIRIFGAFAGVLVTLYGLWKLRGKGYLFLIWYWITALGVTWMFWPFLWNSPVANFQEAFLTMSSFQWNGIMLYNGQLFRSSELPWDYLPRLLWLKLTLPVMILAGLALLGWLLKPAKHKKLRLDLALLILWFFLPVLGSFIPGANLYDNLRQSLFILPPLFVFAGIGLQALLDRVRRPFLSGSLAAVILLPSIIAIIQLHPYEYTYFNALAGGTRGAYQKFEMDYWFTSSREALALVPELTEDDIEIGYNGPLFQLHAFAPDGPDFVQVRANGKPVVGTEPDYAVIVFRGGRSIDEILEYEIIATVERMKVPFAAVIRYGGE